MNQETNNKDMEANKGIQKEIILNRNRRIIPHKKTTLENMPTKE